MLSHIAALSGVLGYLFSDKAKIRHENGLIAVFTFIIALLSIYTFNLLIRLIYPKTLFYKGSPPKEVFL